MKRILIYILLLAVTNANRIAAQTITATHTYDNLNRLTGTTYSNGTSMSYQYDALGNRTTKTIVGSPCPTPVANFTFVINSNSASFTNTSTNATSYSWNFGNGQTSTQTNPTVTYLTPGTYNVCLTATNACGSVQTCQTVTVICSPLNLNLISSASPSCVPGCDGVANVTYTANYSYAIAPSGAMISSTGSGSGLCAATVYTITATSTSGCTGTTTVQLAAPPPPVVTITSNPANATICAGASMTLTASGASSYNWSPTISNAISFIPTTTTTYTVTGFDNSTGCASTATKTVTVNPLPVITINPTPNDTICQGAAISLTASGGASYNWSGGIQQALPFTPSTSSIYTVTATSAAGCNKTATQSVVVTSPCGSCLPSVIIQGNPFTTALTESGGWIQNSSVVLIPSGANVKLDAHANSFVQLNPGFQTITGAVFLARPFNGCTAGAPSIAILDTSSATKSESIPELITTNEYLVVYPNPTSGRIKVAFNQKVDEIRLYDQFGKLLQKHIPLSDAETELDLSPYSNGMYYLRANGFIPVKVIKH